MTTPPPLQTIAVIGCVAFVIGLVASLITDQWQWALLVAAGFLAATLWAAAERHHDE